MNAIQDRCRPKHQVLVLKCYPRTRKGAVDVKPNSSELSYLLFYATSRRSKIQKIGAFIEKKTASDVWRVRIGNVQVTLQILAALIEKSPKDLPLIASCVLRVLSLVLESKDVTMVESSIPTFEAFCDNHDASSLFADQDYVRQYEAVVKGYASLASPDFAPNKLPASKPLAMRWRNAGLEAIRSIASSDALSSLVGRQLSVIVPIVLENLWNENEDFVETLGQRVEMEEKVDSERLTRRRTSVATVRTFDTAGEPNPIALSGTAVDVDKLAEEDISVLAMQCLKRIFVVPNRPQIHSATQSLLTFIEGKIARGESVIQRDPKTGKDVGWAIKAFELIARWASVQDRYMILVTTMDTIVRTLVRDENMPIHLALIAMVGSLLRSDINLIGLSVMDVLLQLIQQMKKLLLLPSLTLDDADKESEDRSAAAVEQMQLVRSRRKEYLNRIQQCMGDLATHIYYTDQISDMVSTILHRVKPTRSSSSATSSPHAEHEDEGGELVDRTGQVEAYFSFSLAKVAALKAVKAILLVANPPSRNAENLSLSRNRVPIQVWDGTHWLLREPDGLVRKAYVDAFYTWLDRETTRADAKVSDDTPSPRSSPQKPSRDLAASAFARRAASSASNPDKSAKASRSRFLQLLHIAIYDNAIQHVDFDSDYVLLHVLLAKLVACLGVNAARFGLPMVYRLQEDIQEAETPMHKVRIGSLVHGYFWILTERFDFEASVVGRAILNEVIRRRSKQFWVEGISIPPPLVDQLGTPGVPGPDLPLHDIETESLLPFDDRLSLVDAIAIGYQEMSVSPAVSPAASPGRTFAHPVMNSSMSAGTVAVTGPDSDLPVSYRETMLTEWTRDQAMLALQSGSKSGSLNGSKSGTTGTANRNRLVVNVNGNGNGNGLNGGYIGGQSPTSPYASQHNLRPGSAHHGGGLAPGHGLRKSSVRSGISAAPSDSSRGYVTTVDQLKQVLTGEVAGPLPGTRAGAEVDGDSDSVDSMASYDYTPSELSFNPEAVSQRQSPVAYAAADSTPFNPSLPKRTLSKGKSVGPLTSNPTHESGPVMDGPAEEDEGRPSSPEGDVPPVPPLPRLTTLASSKSGDLHGGGSPGSVSPLRALSNRSGVGGRPSTERKLSGSRAGERKLSSRGGESVRITSFGERKVSGGGGGNGGGSGMDLHELLRVIDSRAGEPGLGNLTRPPY